MWLVVVRTSFVSRTHNHWLYFPSFVYYSCDEWSTNEMTKPSMSPHANIRLPDRLSFPDEELKTLELWKDLDAFMTSLRLSKVRKPFTFYDGPPFATGLPHHVCRATHDAFFHFSLDKNRSVVSSCWANRICSSSYCPIQWKTMDGVSRQTVVKVMCVCVFYQVMT